MFGPLTFPVGATSATIETDLTKVLVDNWTKERSSAELLELASAATFDVRKLEGLLNGRAKSFYGFTEFNPRTLDFLWKQEKRDAILQLMQQHLSDPFSRPEVLSSFDAVTVEEVLGNGIIREADDDQLNNIQFALYWMTLTVDNRVEENGSTGFRRTLDAFKAIRPGDAIYANFLSEVHSMQTGRETISLHYVGITVRNPRLRIAEHLTAGASTLSRFQAMRLAAGDDLQSISAHTVLTAELHQMTLTRTIIRLNHRARRLLPSQLNDNLVTFGDVDAVVTMRLGKDPTKEAHRFGIPFYDESIGGRGPRAFVKRVNAALASFRDKLLISDKRYQDLIFRKLFFGPFRDVYETLPIQQNAETLTWLQKVLSTIRPWHINVVGSDALGVLLYGLVERVDPSHTGLAPSVSAVRTDASWVVRDYADFVGQPIICKYGHRNGDYCIVVSSFDPGLYAYDPFLAGYRFALNELNIAVNMLVTAVVFKTITENDVRNLNRYMLLTTDILPEVKRQMQVHGITSRLDMLNGELRMMNKVFIGSRQSGLPPRTSVQIPWSRFNYVMVGRRTSPIDTAVDAVRVRQVEGLVNQLRTLQQRGITAKQQLRKLLPLPLGVWDDDEVKIEAWQAFLMNVDEGANPYLLFTWTAYSRGYTERVAEQPNAVLKPALEKIIDHVGSLRYFVKLSKATAFHMRRCSICQAPLTTGKDMDYPESVQLHFRKHHPTVAGNAATMCDELGWVYFLHDIAGMRPELASDFAENFTRRNVTWVTIQDLLPEWMLVTMKLPEQMQKNWRIALLKGACIPLHSDIASLVTDTNNAQQESSDSVGDNNDEEEDLDHLQPISEEELQAREYVVQLALDYLLGMDEEEEVNGPQTSVRTALAMLSPAQRRNIPVATMRERTRLMPSLDLTDRSVPFVWAVCGRSQNPCSRVTIKKNLEKPQQHRCPNAPSMAAWRLRPDMAEFLELPATYRRWLFRSLLFHRSADRDKCANVGITAENVFQWQVSQLDDVNPIPSEIVDRQPVDITKINWVTPTRTPSRTYERFRVEVAQLRRELRSQGESRTAIERASFSLLMEQGFPTEMRKTIIRQVRKEEAMVIEVESQRASQLTAVEEEEVLSGISQNSFPSQAPAWDDGDDGEENDEEEGDDEGDDEDTEGVIHTTKRQRRE
ncbi:hypothetical protein HDU85_004665 [Gaertneriomyces sp. JEL0708]|nr:hypothetical protein HDU85_004665 [Gaertneriomyces sp. JEL0708]